MALRSPALWMGNPAILHPAQNDRLFIAGLHRADPASTASNKPLTALSGVVHGPAGTMGEVALLSNTQYTVNPARWVIQSTASALGGAYRVTNDALLTKAITAQDATQYRKSQLVVWVSDTVPVTGQSASGDDSSHLEIVDGALAASNPQLPAGGSIPANALILGEFYIPPVGGAVTYTPYDVRTGLHGGVLPVTATDTRLPAFDGQMRWNPTAGLQAGRSGAWGPPQLMPRVTASRTSAQTVSGSTVTPVQFQAASTRATAGMWAIANPTRLVAPETAEYDLTLLANWQVSSNVGGLAVGYQVNGVGTSAKYIDGRASNAYYDTQQGNTLRDLELNAGDYVEMLVVMNTDSSRALNLNTRATLELVRR